MLSRSIEFREVGEVVEMWVERDCGPFDDYLAGLIKRDEDGFYRLYPSDGVAFTCRQLTESAQKISDLNTN